jgi:hypothetical protein
MAQEHVAVASMHYIISRLQIPFQVLDCKTDALNLKVAEKHLPKLKAAIEGVTYADMHNIRRAASGQTFLDSGCKLHKRSGTGTVYRFREDASRLKGNYKTPTRQVSEPKEMAPWEDLDEASARVAVLARKSLLVTGYPGVGKSHFVADLCKELEAKDLVVTILSKTHASCAELNCKLIAAGSTFRAVTCDHWANATVRRGVCQSDCIVLKR